MVINYQGERMPQPAVSVDERLSVRDHMAKNLITFTPEQTVSEVTRTLLEHGFSGAPVINGKNELVGIISEGDCIKELVSEKYHNYPTVAARVVDCMVTDVIHISPEMHIFEVAKMFLDLRIRRFPVLDRSGRLIGQISQKDVIRAIQEMQSNTWHE